MVACFRLFLNCTGVDLFVYIVFFVGSWSRTPLPGWPLLYPPVDWNVVDAFVSFC